jgi:hypothetical protein
MNRNRLSLCALLVALACLGLAVPSSLADDCNGCIMGREQLKHAREVALKTYVERVNGDLEQYRNACQRYYSEDVRLSLRGVGAYTGKVECEEYGYLLYIRIEGQPFVQLEQHLDEYTLEWSTSEAGAAAGDADDTAFFVDVTTYYITDLPGMPPGYVLTVGALRNRQTVVFEPCSDLIKFDYVVNDPLALALIGQVTAATPEAACAAAMSRCTGDLQPYGSMQECVDFMAALDASSVPHRACPYPVSANTTTCRNYHASNAFIDPDIHCQHTQVDSMTCVDQCRPACDACPVHSHCVDDYPDLSGESVTFRCVCDEGYVQTASDPATGAAACAPASCSALWQCASAAPPSVCNAATTGLCGCAPGFRWDPLTGTCACDGQVRWDVPEGVDAPQCVPEGRCMARQHCTAQAWNRVQCRDSTPLNPLAYPLLSCRCNAGFLGGYENPCVCPYGESAVKWAPAIGGEVCLAPGQCSDPWQCGYGRACAGIDPSTGVGLCQ